MEPTDLNSPSSDDRGLEALLRRSQPVLPADGFSARVLAALPEKTSSPAPSRLRVVTCLVGAACGVLVAFAQGASFGGLDLAWHEMRDSLVTTSLFFGDSRLVIAFAVTVASLLFAFRVGKPRARSIL